jgi:hypothetical protein
MPTSTSRQANRAWQGLVRSLLPLEGARANARDAVLANARAAEQRREAALAMARSTGHPTALDLEGRRRG